MPGILSANNDYTTLGTDEWNASDAAEIKLSGDTATSDAAGVTVASGSVTITAAGVYRLTGDYSGQIIVNAPADAQVVLILDNANISTTAGAAVDVQQAEDAAIHLADNSQNSVSDASSYADSSTANAAIYADSDLTISGAGSLTVKGNGNDGIASSDDLTILGGKITVDATDDGLRGKDALAIEGGEISITAGGDGLKSDQETDEAKGYIYIADGKITVDAAADGVQAYTDVAIAGGSLTVTAADDGIKSEVNTVIDGGSVTVTNSVEALESFNIGINGGDINLTSSDDAVNAAGDLSTLTYVTGSSETSTGPGGGTDTPGGQLFNMTGGTLTVNSEGDGIDSNGDINISGGTITINGTEHGGNGAVDVNGSINITGGTVFATSGGGMEVPLSGSQGWIIANINVSRGQTVTVTDDAGNTIGEFQAVKSATAVSVSDPAIINRQNYTVTLDNGDSVTVTAGEFSGGGFR